MAGRKMYPLVQTDHEKKAMDEAFAVGRWLQNKVGLPKYIEKFITNGYDSMDTIIETMKEKDLIKIGVKDADAKKIMKLIKKLRRTFPKRPSKKSRQSKAERQSKKKRQSKRQSKKRKLNKEDEKSDSDEMNLEDHVKHIRANPDQKVDLNEMMIRASKNVPLRHQSQRFSKLTFGSKRLQKAARHAEIKQRTMQMYESLWKESQKDVEIWKGKWYDLYQKYNDLKAGIEKNDPDVKFFHKPPGKDSFAMAKNLSAVQKTHIQEILDKYKDDDEVENKPNLDPLGLGIGFDTLEEHEDENAKSPQPQIEEEKDATQFKEWKKFDDDKEVAL